MDIEKRNAEIRAAFHAAGIRGQGIVFDVLDSGAVDVSTMKPVNMTPDVIGDKADHGTKVAWLLHEACPEAEIRSYYCLTGKHIMTALQSVLDHAKAEPEKQHIVNVSMVGSDTDGMEELIDQLTAMNVPVVCAAGNDGEERLNRFPSCYQSPYTASAIQKDGSKCDFSTWHDEVDFAELGKSVQTRRADQATIKQSGTSFSSPILAGKIGLLHCEAMQKGKRLTDGKLYDRLKAVANDLGSEGRDPYYGWGYVDIMPEKAATSAPVATVPAGKITAAQLVEAFHRFLSEGWGYVYGGQGEVYTEALAKKYTAAGRNVPSGRDKSTYFTKDCAKWYGHRVADCSGGIIEAFRLHVPKYGDATANGLYGRCTKTGPIDELPDVLGLCLWKKGHIGVYVGIINGKRMGIEFRGTDYGCVMTEVEKRPWTNWGYLDDVIYDGQAVPAPKEPAGPTVLKVTTPYMRGDEIKALQNALNGLGYDCGDADGIYGPKSDAAVQAFVQVHGGTLPERIKAYITIGNREYTGELEG